MNERRGETRSWDALDAEESIVLSNTFTTSGGTSLDLSSAEGNDEISDDGVLGLTGSVRDHDTPAIRLRQLSTVKPHFRLRVHSTNGQKPTPEWIQRSFRFG